MQRMRLSSPKKLEKREKLATEVETTAGTPITKMASVNVKHASSGAARVPGLSHDVTHVWSILSLGSATPDLPRSGQIPLPILHES